MSKKRFLIVINSLDVGGAERLVVDLLPLYLGRGIDVQVLLLEEAKNDTFAEKLYSNSELRVSCLNTKSLFDIRVLFKLLKVIPRFDVVHVHLFPSLYWVGLAKFFSRSKVKLVFTEHSTFNKRRNSWLFKLLDCFIYNLYSRIICISAETKNALLEVLPNSRDKLTVIHNGVDLTRYEQALPLAITDFKPFLNPDDVLIVQVASFRTAKDQDTLIRALSLMPDHFKVMFVGDGERRRLCEELVTSLNLTSRVLFLGVRDEVERIIKMADYLVVSSHVEGFGLAAVEAMASRTQVFASNVDGVADVVSDSRLLFDVGDENDLVEKLMAVHADGELKQQLLEELFQRAQGFSLSKMMDGYVDVYKRVGH